MSVFVDEHEAEANSIKGRAYQAVNAALHNVFEKYANAHGLGFVGNFKAQAITDNRIQRHLPAPVGTGALADDDAIRALQAKIVSGKTAALAYAWNIDIAALPNLGVANAIYNYQDNANLANLRNYDLAQAVDVLALAKAKAKLEDPHADDT